MSKVALISGIAGQDGSYLAELLLAKGYEVHGIIRMNSMHAVKNSWRDRGDPVTPCRCCARCRIRRIGTR